MASQSNLRPGWRIWAATLADMQDPRFGAYARAEKSRRINRFLDEARVRQDEIMPPGQNARLMDQVVQAIKVVIGESRRPGGVPMWPDDVVSYIVKHGGETAIDQILSANPLLHRMSCPHGSGCDGDYHILDFSSAESKVQFIEEMERPREDQGDRDEGERVLLLTGFPGGLLGGSPFGFSGGFPYAGESMTEEGREPAGSQRGASGFRPGGRRGG